MTLIPLQNEVFLTCGGTSPQLILWNYKTKSLIKISYPRFNSVYTLAIDPKIMEIAAGTRNGLIYIHDLAQVKKKKLPFKKTLIQGSPVLSLCWVGNRLLAVSDKAGRCFIWNIDQASIFQILETQGNIICSLFYKKDTLYGLSMNARLLLWNMTNQKKIKGIKIPRLPKIGSLVNLVFWPAANALVFPGNDGRLCLYKIDTGAFSTVKAHDGSFYSIFLYGEYLATIGIKDHQCKMWCKNAHHLASSYPIDQTIISAVCLSTQQNRFLLTNLNGSAYEYILEPQGFKLIQQLQGQDYRICVSLNPGAKHQLKKEYQKNKAHEISDKIMNCNGQISDNELDSLYEELTEIGFNHVRLAMQADQAEKKGDLFKAIDFTLDLLSIIPKGSKESCPTMEKYVTLLEKTWNLTEALRVGKEILKIDPTNHCAKKIINLYESSGINQDSWIIEPDIPLETVLKSASAIKNIRGRYVIKTLDKIICEKFVLTPELIIEKYNKLQNIKNRNLSYKMTLDHAHFFSNKKLTDIQVISFSSDETFRYLQFAARIICSGSGTIIIPIILFDCRNLHINKTTGNNDVDIFSMFLRIKTCPSSNMYLTRLHKILHQTLQRLITEKTAKKQYNNDL